MATTTTITGTGGADVLVGTALNDVINGGAGADDMTGGLGHDTYYVDNANDYVFENLGEGTDTIISSISFDYMMPLFDNVEHLTLTGSAIYAVGNGWDNVLTGTAGNNTLDGGGGADLMIGGAGDDEYHINLFSTSGINDQVGSTDVIVDSKGHDVVMAAGSGLSSMKYIMQNGLEDAIFAITDCDSYVIGNKSANVITTDSGNDTLNGGNGNDTLTSGDGDDTLDGGKGSDTMIGGAGDDTYIYDNKHDVIIENSGEGTDTVMVSYSYDLPLATEIENILLSGTKGLRASGNNFDNSITGNTGNNVLYGLGGDDVIDGGGGKDTLYGGTGADAFKFSVIKGVVTIKDFSVAQGDTLDVQDIIGYSGSSAISDFVHVVDRGNDSYMYINSSGDGLNSHFVLVAKILGTNGLTGEDQLLADNVLIASGS